VSDIVKIADVYVKDRIRKDLGDIDSLCNSIREYGIIQPIVLTTDNNENYRGTTLVAGGRRLTAVKRLGWTELVHARDFIWRGEENDFQRRSVELEENLRRKELSWQEQLTAKQELMDLMQTIYGPPKAGPVEALSSKPGFGVNRLASMLGESPATTSTDLKVATAMLAMPQLRYAKNKSEVLTKLKIAGTIVSMQATAPKVTDGNSTKYWTLFETDASVGSSNIGDSSIDLVWTDLPYGADVNEMSSQVSSALAHFDDSRRSIVAFLDTVARESYRVLREDRFAVFCFGFTYYNELVTSLERAGFNVNVVPFVWIKNTKSGENPNTRYSNCYEPLLVGAKGRPSFVKPGQGNTAFFPVVQDKLQIVQKPVALVERFLLDMTAEGATIVDWCCGTGTTGVACHNLKRHAILFEKEPSMALIARARLEALK
jgi:ParB family chromosome partitioning protein